MWMTPKQRQLALRAEDIVVAIEKEMRDGKDFSIEVILLLNAYRKCQLEADAETAVDLEKMYESYKKTLANKKGSH